MSTADLNSYTRELEPSEFSPAVLVGNGLNRYQQNGKGSWQEVLSEAINEHSTDNTWAEEHFKQMSLLQMFDILSNELSQSANLKSKIKRSISEKLRAWEPTRAHPALVKSAIKHKIPLLTLNFDRCLLKADPRIANNHKFIHGHYQPKRYHSGSSEFSWQYPWMCHFSDHMVHDVKNEFAVWHLHGTCEYHGSIRMGLDDYVGMSSKARAWMHMPNGLLKGGPDWKWFATWFEIFFNSQLYMYGLGLGRDELFLRWLLIQRAARFKKVYPDRAPETVFLSVKSEITSPSGRELCLFLEKVGVKVILVRDRRTLYETFPRKYLQNIVKRMRHQS